MKKHVIFLFSVIMLLTLGSELFALGRRQAEEEVTPINPQWILFITDFDVSSMSPAWQTAGDAITRSLISSLQNVDFRVRGEDEYLFYRDLAWTRSRAAAASALATSRHQRDQLIFRGALYWQHERDLRTAQEQITRLEEALLEVEATPPVVEQRPVFRLHASNIAGNHHAPPEPGRENQFLTTHNANAFLSGRLSEFHGRLLLEIRMFTRHTGSFSFEDWVLFSPEDFDEVLEEIAERMSLIVSGSYPATLFVQATPSSAMILLDGVFIGLGQAEHSRLPGEVEITVQADNYAPVTIPLQLASAERTEVIVNLSPLGISAFTVDTISRPGSRVHLDGLFVGETPITLQLPSSDFSYITVETEEGEVGAVIVRDSAIVSGYAEFVRVGDDHGWADFMTMFPPTEEERQVERARNSFYRAYGALWIALPLSMLASGVARNHLNSNNPSQVSRANMIRTTSNVVIGATLGATFFQIFRYIRVSGTQAMPMVRPPEPIIEYEYDEYGYDALEAAAENEIDQVDEPITDDIEAETEVEAEGEDL